ncbi:hypothetical protein [Cohnella terricola]|uniref:Uncharacterized protein n=1 Tax=Cohnella terricola TaxID=1289167 RepID=A0A559JCH8_9BACL|nr:hypothetical protein [Cohnella terricola]TVX97579.1 hypothetical protein FPZ45_17540 [Cohnella terricola]
MKYFISDEHWDIDGYWKQLRSLSNRFSKDTFNVISNHSFHDARVLELNISNTSLLRRSLDPTSIEAKIQDIDGYEYVIQWSGINQLDLSFSGKKKIYRSDEADDYYLELEDRRGLEEWAYDEITSIDNTYLQHEITLHSEALIKLIFRRMIVKRIRRWHDIS